MPEFEGKNVKIVKTNYGSGLIINETCYSVVLKSLMYLCKQHDRYTTHLLLKRTEIY